MKIFKITLLAMCVFVLSATSSFAADIPFSYFDFIELVPGQVAITETLFDVPDGKRVVIEQVAAECGLTGTSSENIIRALSINVYGVSAVFVGFPIPLVQQGDSWVGNLHTRIYGSWASDYNDVKFSLNRDNGDGTTTCGVSISGLLVTVRGKQPL